MPKNFDDWEQEHLRNNRSITKNILLMERISGNVKTLNVNDLDLFGSRAEPAKKETETLPIPKTASQNINNLEVHELTYEEFLTRYKKYKEQDFSIGKTQVVYLEKKDKYKMSYATARGVQHYTGDFIEVLKQAYDNVIDRATKLGKLDKPEIVPVPEHTDESNKVEIVSDNKAQSFIKVIQTNIQACIAGEGKILNKTQRGKIGESMGITAQKEVKELTELAIVLLAREQALRPDLSLRER